MADRDDIIDTITRLFVATDNRDWATVRAVFAPSVAFDMSSLGAGAPETRTNMEIAAGWETGLAGIEHVYNLAGNYLVDLQGDEATAFCYAIAYHHNAGKARRFIGSYDFHLVRGDTGWRITVFKFNLKFIEE